MTRKTSRDSAIQLGMFGTGENGPPPSASRPPSPAPEQPDSVSGTCRPVSIVIPTWNGRELLERFLPSVVAALVRYSGAGEILVVDDGSTDRTGAFMRRVFPDVRLIEIGFNRGFAAAVNRGVLETLHDTVILLNNDVGVAEDFIAPLVNHFSDRSVFAVGAKSLDWDRKRFHDGGKIGTWKRGFWRVWQNYDLPGGKAPEGLELLSFYTPGGFAAFDKGRWILLEGLDELFRPFNWEDTDICYRALKRGWKVLYEPSSVVYHRPNTTIGGGAFRRGYVRYVSRRNRLFFHWKNLTDPLMLAEHIFQLALSLPLSLLRLDFPAVGALFGALGSLRKVLERRKVEKERATVSDREIRERYYNFLYENELFLIKP